MYAPRVVLCFPKSLTRIGAINPDNLTATSGQTKRFVVLGSETDGNPGLGDLGATAVYTRIRTNTEGLK